MADKAELKANHSSGSQSSSRSSTSTLHNIITTGIQHPGKNDVMFGRGGDTNYHVGNLRFRMLAQEYRQSYQEASRMDKSVIVQQLVDRWRAEDPPGRFLIRTDPSKGSESLWHDVGTEMALQKAAKILRERQSRETKVGGSKNKRQGAATSASGEGDQTPQKRQRQQPQQHQQQQQQQEQQQRQRQHYLPSLQQQPLPNPPNHASYQQYPPFAFQMPLPLNQLQSMSRLGHTGVQSSQRLVVGSEQFQVPSAPFGAENFIRNTAGISAARTPVQQHRSSVDLGRRFGLQAHARAEGISEVSETINDSSAVEAGLGVVIPIAASLVGVFNSSNSHSGSSGGKANTDSSPSTE